MAEKTINATIKTRNDTSTNWTTANPVLAVGEIGFETDTFLFKVGNGTSTWSLLPYTRTKYDSAGNSILDTYISNIDLSGNTITALNKSGVSVDSVSLTTNNVTATKTNRYVPAIPSSNSSSMYLNGDGIFVSIVTGGATSVENLYLSNTASDVSGYKTINYTAASTATEISVSCTNSRDVLSYSYLYPTAIGTTTIDAGMWKSSFSIKSSVTNGIKRLRLDCFVRTTSGTETILFSRYTVPVNTTSYSRYSTETNRNIFTVNSTDRLGFKIYGNTDRSASTTITYQIGGADPSYINTPLPLRHAELRDKNGESGYQHLTQTQVDKLNGIETGAQVNTVTGVKGNSETTYRIGDINITPTNIGLGNVDNTADSAKVVASAAKLTTARTISLTGDITGSTSFDGSSDASIATTASSTIATKTYVDTTKTKVYSWTVSIPLSSWAYNSTDGDYQATVTVTGMTLDVQITNIYLGNDSIGNDAATSSYLLLTYGNTNDGSITFHASNLVSSSIQVIVQALINDVLPDSAETYMKKIIYDPNSTGTVNSSDTAVKLKTARSIGSSLFDGTADITLAAIGAKPDFSENTAFNKNFGTVNGTVCQGGDSRLSDSRRASNITMSYNGNLYITYS